MGFVQLQDRVSFLVVVVGLFAIAEVTRMVEGTLQGTMHTVRVQGKLWFTREEWRRAKPAIFRGSAIGFFCGAAPGLGGTIAAMLAYVTEKKISKRPQEFGHGAIEGVAAPEAATNADTCGAFVHLLALGIPGSGSTAVIMGAFIMYGIQPGPMLFTTHPDLVWGLIASMYIGNLMLLVLNLPMIGMWVQLLKLPYNILFPLIILFTIIGVYCSSNNVFDVYVMIAFGVIGYFMRKLGYEPAPLVLAFVLGPMLENNLRKSLILSQGDLMTFVQRPISAACLVLAVVLLVGPLLPSLRKKRELVALDEGA
jgi:putative tricarboxylic transport membrane protein